MKFLTSRRSVIIMSVVIFVIAVTLFFTYSHTGRVWGTYAVGGFFAPFSIKTSCMSETGRRVEEKFSTPLLMNEEGVIALREYWHYAFYRECLYTAGYSFLGKDLPRATLKKTADANLYTNHLAGLTLELPLAANLTKKDELDVEYDYRLYQSEFLLNEEATSTITLHVYTSFDDIVDFISLYENLETILFGIPLVEKSLTTTASNHTYVTYKTTENTCGWALYTPQDRLVLAQSNCDATTTLQSIVESVTFLPLAVSVH